MRSFPMPIPFSAYWNILRGSEGICLQYLLDLGCTLVLGEAPLKEIIDWLLDHAIALLYSANSKCFHYLHLLLCSIPCLIRWQVLRRQVPSSFRTGSGGVE